MTTRMRSTLPEPLYHLWIQTPQTPHNQTLKPMHRHCQPADRRYNKEWNTYIRDNTRARVSHLAKTNNTGCWRFCCLKLTSNTTVWITINYFVRAPWIRAAHPTTDAGHKSIIIGVPSTTNYIDNQLVTNLRTIFTHNGQEVVRFL